MTHIIVLKYATILQVSCTIVIIIDEPTLRRGDVRRPRIISRLKHVIVARCVRVRVCRIHTSQALNCVITTQLQIADGQTAVRYYTENWGQDKWAPVIIINTCIQFEAIVLDKKIKAPSHQLVFLITATLISTPPPSLHDHDP